MTTKPSESFKKFAELKVYADKQAEKIELLEKEIANLKTQLATPNLIEPAKKVSDEEVICVTQIEKLREIATKRSLTLEEVKMLDLLNKNLLLIRKVDPDEPEVKKPVNVAVADLIKLVKS